MCAFPIHSCISNMSFPVADLDVVTVFLKKSPIVIGVYVRFGEIRIGHVIKDSDNTIIGTIAAIENNHTNYTVGNTGRTYAIKLYNDIPTTFKDTITVLHAYETP